MNMTKQQILDYKVIPSSEKAKESFNKMLEDRSIQIVNTFTNEYGELFVLYRMRALADLAAEVSKYYDYNLNPLFITGDELGWEPGWQYESGHVYQPFGLSPEERDLAEKAVAIEKAQIKKK